MQEIIKAKSYLIRNDYAWGVFVLDCEHNTVFCHTDHGDFNYCWNAHGCKNIAHFLPGIDMYYAMGKFRGRDFYTIDEQGTEKRVKELILEQRLERYIDSIDARDAWEHIESSVGYTNADVFYMTMCENETLSRMICEDEFHYDTIPDTHCVAFWEKLWKPFIEEIKKDEIYNWEKK